MVPAVWRRMRAEFEGWARGLAAEHGYAVSFDGVGHASGEGAALASPAFRGGHDLGCATQVGLVGGRLPSKCDLILVVQSQPSPTASPIMETLPVLWVAFGNLCRGGLPQ